MNVIRPSTDNHSGAASPLRYANLLLRRRRAVLAPAVLLALLGVALWIFGSGSFSTTSRFLPQAEQGSSPLAGLAAQFGVPVAPLGGGSGESPDFYAALITSRGLLREVAVRTYPSGGSEGREGEDVPLARVLGIDEEDPAERVTETVDWLREHVSATADPRTQLVTVEVTAPEESLAVALNASILELVNRFNMERRQSRAAAERRFIEERVGEARRELEAAEDDLSRFMGQNRRYENSPELVVEASRLQRRVDFQQQVVTSLVKSLEEARIDEVRNTPVLTVVEQPQDTVGPAGLSPLVRIAVLILVGLILGIVIAVFLEYVSWNLRTDEEAAEEFRVLTRETFSPALRQGGEGGGTPQG